MCVCVTQRHHHHRQQRWGVVQTSGWHQVKAVHLPAAERQIHYQALVKKNKNTHVYRQRPSSLLCFFMSPFHVVSLYILAICTVTQTHLTSLSLCICNKKKSKYQYLQLIEGDIFSVNMYVCWYYWQGHKVSFSLERRSMQSAAKKKNKQKKTSVENRSSSELWITELSRVPFWDKTMPTLMEGEKKKKVLNYKYQCSEALLCTVLAPRGLKRVNEPTSTWETMIQVRMQPAVHLICLFGRTS